MKRILRISLILTAVLSLNACSDLFDNELITTNPNAVDADAVPTEKLLSGTLLGVGKLHEDTDTRIAYMWSGQLTGSNRQHLALAQYIVSSSTFAWDIYYGTGGNARIIQEKSDEVGDTWIKGISQVAEVLVMAKVVSLWGDAPYAEAFNISEFPTPHYDDQLTLYNSLIATLNSAITNLSATTGLDAGSSDIFYEGDLEKWIAAANTLKARLYLHLGDYANAITSAQAGISSPDGDMLMPHGQSQDIDQNLNYSFFVNTRSGDTNFSSPAVLPGLMSASDFKRNAKTDETALYNHFFQQGLIVDGALDANINDDGFFAQDASQPILTFYENQLILAESAARLNSTATAIDALNSVRVQLATGYINGKTVSDDNKSLGIKYDDYDAGDFATQSDLIYEIILTKYIVTLSQYESFNDVRRIAKATPVVTLPVTPIVSTRTGDIPGRFVYPLVEVNTNPNVPTVSDQFEKLTIFQ